MVDYRFKWFSRIILDPQRYPITRQSSIADAPMQSITNKEPDPISLAKLNFVYGREYTACPSTDSQKSEYKMMNPLFTLRLEPGLGLDLGTVYRKAVDLSLKLDVGIRFTFNDTSVLVYGASFYATKMEGQQCVPDPAIMQELHYCRQTFAEADRRRALNKLPLLEAHTEPNL